VINAAARHTRPVPRLGMDQFIRAFGPYSRSGRKAWTGVVPRGNHFRSNHGPADADHDRRPISRRPINGNQTHILGALPDNQASTASAFGHWVMAFLKGSGS
jgi:hypothetical protein